MIGCDYDNYRDKTKVVPDNGFNPMWDENFKIGIRNPSMAVFRLAVYDEARLPEIHLSIDRIH